MKHFLMRAAVSAALVGAVFAIAPPLPSSAANCPIGAPARQCIASSLTGATSVEGVPASFNWAGATAIQGGAEVRARYAANVAWYSPVNFIPRIGMTAAGLCRSGSACTGADVIPRTSIRIAVAAEGGCSQTVVGATCMNTACSTGDRVALFYNTGTSAAFRQANPATLNTGPVIPAAGTAGANLCNSASQSGPFRIQNFYIGVLVPAGKTSGSYTGTITFALENAP